MNHTGLVSVIALPLFFGLAGFVEPCSVGSTLLVLKQIEGAATRTKVLQTLTFALTRAVLIGSLGVLAALAGAAFLGLQKAAWLVLGLGYVALGVLYLTGRAGVLMRSFGPNLAGLRSVRGSIALGLLFGLNVPACAAPLILALLGSAAVGGAAGASAISGFASLALFGLALSLPLVIAVFLAPARAALDKVAALSRRAPGWTGWVLVALGGWSVWSALFVSIRA